MSSLAAQTNAPPRAFADVLAIGFATTVAMWAAGYVGRLPAVMAPPALLLGAFLAFLLAGGFLAGRFTPRGVLGGFGVGLLSGAVNLLVLGSLLAGDAPNRIRPSAGLWVPGFIAVSAGLGAAGAWAGARGRRVTPPETWSGLFASVTVVATLLLLAVGGLVTSQEAGLAVVDWPNSYGYNMFLFPLARMTGGIYYEHAHRLFGALVGLTTLCLAVVLHRVEPRAWVRGLGWAALGLVVVQGVLGGLRVTGRFTWSTSAIEMAPSLALAAVHGVVGQVFLAAMVSLAVVTSRGWRSSGPPAAHPSAGTDRGLSWALVGILLVQLVLGAVQRHFAAGLLVHVTVAVVVLHVAVAAAIRAWLMYPDEPVLGRLGKAVLVVTGAQLLLGLGALVATGVLRETRLDLTPLGVAATTAHQWCGAALLALAVSLALWSRRRLAPTGSPDVAQ